MNTLMSIFTNKAIRGIIWFAIRLYLGYEWIYAAIDKLGKDSAVWVGPKAGTGVKGFLNHAVSPQMTGGDHPSVLSWYAWLVNHVFLPNATALSYLIAYGELLVGIALIIGLFTRFTVFFGALMNLNFLLAGSTGINVPMFTLELAMLLVGGTAGLIGVDYFVLPLLSKLIKRDSGREVAAPAEAPMPAPVFQSLYERSTDEKPVENPLTTATKQ